MSLWQNRKEVPSSSKDFSRPCPESGYYDVFLSFRGVDTRYGFTHNLYHFLQESEVYTFMDVDLTGEDIGYLFKVVEKSRMAVVIYSENFASSDWCLRELDLILQRRKEKKMMIIPIFYKVDVHELKHLTGNTMKCLDKHISKHGKSTEEKWMDVLKDFGNISGLSYKNSHGRPEYDFTMDVIVKIKKKLRESEEIVEPHYENIGTRDNLMKKLREIEEIQEGCVIEPHYENIGTRDNLMSVSQDRLSGKKCIKLSSRSLKIVWADDPKFWGWISSSEPKSSFKEVALLKDVYWFDIRGKMNTELLSPGTCYGVYFVFKLTGKAFGFKDQPMEVRVEVTSATDQTAVEKSVYLDMEGRTRDQIVPKQRKDGWSEIEMGDFYVEEGEEAMEVAMSVLEVKGGNSKRGMMVEGIEFRPKSIII